GGGGGHHHKQHHVHNPNRPPNRNQIFDSSGPDVRVRGNAHQVFDKYQALAREAASSGDRVMAEAYWQYADHYFRLIQTMGGLMPRNNQGWGEAARTASRATRSSKAAASRPTRNRPTATATPRASIAKGAARASIARVAARATIARAAAAARRSGRTSPAWVAWLSCRMGAARRPIRILLPTSSPRFRSSRRPPV